MIDYLSTYKKSFCDLGKHICLYGICLYNTWFFKDNILSLLTVPVLGLMGMRNFIMMHDCGHKSYFPTLKLNYVIGSIISIFCICPFNWNYRHNIHHLTSGNKTNKFNYLFNETIIYNKSDYESLSLIHKYFYRIIRDPLIFYTIIPVIKFLFIIRIETILEDSEKEYNVSKKLVLKDCTFNTIGIIILFNILNSYGIFYHFLASMIIGSGIGFILFHNQHTYNPGYIVTAEKWNKKDSGLKGSSFIQVPKYLKYFTMGIEYHHIHHMNAKIPGYNLEEYHNNNYNDDETIVKLSIKDCYNNSWLTLYDEKTKKYVSF